MNRAWLAFFVGVLVVVSPLRMLWAQGAWGPWALYALWGALIAGGAWVVREPE